MMRPDRAWRSESPCWLDLKPERDLPVFHWRPAIARVGTSACYSISTGAEQHGALLDSTVRVLSGEVGV